MDNQLQVILTEQNVATENAKMLLEAFGAPFDEAGVILAGYKEIVVTDENQFDIMAEARSQRLKLKEIRVGVEKRRKELKEDSLRTGKAIDGVAKFVKDTIEPAEQYLEEQEKFGELRAAERAATVKAERVEKLAQYTDDMSLYNFEAMTDEQFASLITTLKVQKDAELAAAKKAEDDRLAAEEAERKRQAEIEADNARLRAEAEKREKEAAAERAKLQAESDKKLAAERAIADEERRKREAIEADQRAQSEEEAHKKAATEDEERQSLLAPDKEKIVAFANALNVLRTQAPVVKTKEAQELLSQVDTVIAGLTEKILAKAKSL